MLLLIGLLPLVVGLVRASASPTIQLGNTTLIGRDISVQQEFFGGSLYRPSGIPYAEPPLASLRFKPSVLKSSLDPYTSNAISYGPACLQVKSDCLTINVLRPKGIPPTTKLPVIYGGGFVGGTSFGTNASVIVAQSVARGSPLIFVSFNYRLGPLGFPQGQKVSWGGNLHIESFGGDKDKITLFGQSAGSIMMSILFLHTSTCGLARAAIFDSGFQGTTPLFPPSRGEVDWQNFVGGVEILQGFAVATAEPDKFNAWPPIIDGPGGIIPDLPSVLLRRGQISRLPFIAGTVLDEGARISPSEFCSHDLDKYPGTSFAPQTVNSTAQLFNLIVALFSPSSSPVTLNTSLYYRPVHRSPGSPFNTGNGAFGLSSQFKRAAAIVGDGNFQSQRRSWIETAANAGVATFGYLFTEPQSTAAPVLGGPQWTQFTPYKKTLMQLNGANLTIIPDTYRAEQIAFLNSDLAVWRR
ncbi:esterase 1 [Mycena leptocephala]|nr:esterase 1 [Mycena leptocephala]